MTAHCERKWVLVGLLAILVMQGLFSTSVQGADSSALRMWSEAPSLVVNPGETADFSIALQASTLFSITVSLSITGLPENWTHGFYLKDLQIQGVHLEAGKTATFQLTVDVPSDAVTGTYEFEVVASGKGLHDSYSFPVSADLPLTLEIQPPQAQAALSLSTTSPEIIVHVGSSLTYPITITNKRKTGDVFVLAVSLPRNWTAAFKISVAGESQEVKKVYIEGNEALELTLEVTPPIEADIGSYPIVVTVGSENRQIGASLSLRASILGSYDVAVTNENLSTSVFAGGETEYELTIGNIGGSEVTNVKVELDGQAPTDFTVRASPLALSSLEPDQETTFTISIKTESDVSAGSYYVKFKLVSDQTEAQKFSLRVDVEQRVGTIVYIGFVPIVAAVIFFFVYRRIRRK